MTVVYQVNWFVHDYMVSSTDQIHIEMLSAVHVLLQMHSPAFLSSVPPKSDDLDAIPFYFFS